MNTFNVAVLHRPRLAKPSSRRVKEAGKITVICRACTVDAGIPFRNGFRKAEAGV